MLSKAKVTGQHPSASSTCLFICAFIFMSYWTMCRWMHLALLEKQNLSSPPGNWQRKITVPKWQRTGRAATKSLRWRRPWKLELILGLVKMTLTFTLGIKWIVDSSINTFLKMRLRGLFQAEEPITWWLENRLHGNLQTHVYSYSYACLRCFACWVTDLLVN